MTTMIIDEMKRQRIHNKEHSFCSMCQGRGNRRVRGVSRHL